MYKGTNQCLFSQITPQRGTLGETLLRDFNGTVTINSHASGERKAGSPA